MPLPQAIPMLHVPDVRTTAQWYESIGFRLTGLHEEESGEATWARLAIGQSEIMLNAGGKVSTALRREVDLYLIVEQLEPVVARLTGRADVVEDTHDTEYGMREYIVRDCNGFWLTFGQSMSATH